jgi:hypothetical protein
MALLPEEPRTEGSPSKSCNTCKKRPFSMRRGGAGRRRAVDAVVYFPDSADAIRTSLTNS